MSQSLERLGIDRLSLDERLELIGQIWDSLSRPDEEVPIPSWHRTEVERRRAQADADPDAAIPWDIVKTRWTNQP